MKITESAIETFAIERLESLGYAYLHGSILAHDGDAPQRTGYGDVILEARLRDAAERINPDWHHDDLDKGKIKVVMTAASSEEIAEGSYPKQTA